MKIAVNMAQAIALLEALEAHGYYRYAHHSAIHRLKQEALESGYLLGWEETKRVYHADSENLAEGYTCVFFEEMTPFLHTLGVPAVDVSYLFDSDVDHTVTVNGIT
ncbi:MAG: hypothetical protein MI924_15445 [Chloroflexales bacterium]|nr:hypothetical protein [Chloroflexales bacterium]